LGRRKEGRENKRAQPQRSNLRMHIYRPSKKKMGRGEKGWGKKENPLVSLRDFRRIP